MEINQKFIRLIIRIMRKKIKIKKILILALIIIGIIIAIVSIVNKKDNTQNALAQESTETETINSPKLKEQRKYEEITITNVEIQKNENQNYILVDIKNENSYSTEAKNITIFLLDSQGNELASIPAMIPALDSEKTIQISASTIKNIDNSYDYRIE